MKRLAVLSAFFCVFSPLLNAQVGPLSPDSFVGMKSDSADDVAADRDARADAKDEKKDAKAWLGEELKERAHILSLLKKVKDEKSADKVGAALLQKYGDKGAKETAMGDAVPPKRPTGPIMEECEEKFESKFRKLDTGIAEQLKRIRKLKLESDDFQDALNVLPPFVRIPEEES